MADTIIAKIFKYNPATDVEPTYITHEVPYEVDEVGKMTGMQVLQYVYENCEAFSYDYSCVGGLCGRCSMMIDGKPGLACWTCLEPGEHVFEPLKGLPVVRDLKVDKTAASNRYSDTILANQTVNKIELIKDIDYDLYWNTLERMNMCRECMCCYADCSALQMGSARGTYVGPGAMAQIAMRHLDPHDEADRVAQAVFSGAFDCIQCGNCNAVCPSAIDIMGAIKMLQDAAEARGMKPADKQ